MKKIKFIIFVVSLISILSSCGTVREGFTNQKKNSSDEFLVEKKSPLIVPPNFDDLPVPTNQNLSENSDQNEIKDLIVKSKENDQNSVETKDVNQTFEENLLDKIKNN